MPLTAYRGHGSGDTYAHYERLFQHNDGTGLYTLPGIMQFVTFLIDVSQQTGVNEFQVFPACLVTMSVDEIERAVAEGGDPEKAFKLLNVVGTTVAKLTRRADRAGRFDHTFTLLLTRAMARSVREHYVRRTAERLREVTQEAGMATNFCFGVASLTEHLVTDTDDMLRKSLRALRCAQRREPEAVELGPATVAVFDFRTMSLDEIAGVPK
ncbi:MAG: hypothetical protein ACE5PT_04160 [Gemmatimonadales bacterium]